MSNTPAEPPGHGKSGEVISQAADAELPAGRIDLREVRYSLPEMLAELKMERRSSMFAMEILDQVEIERIFQSKRRHNAKAD